MEINFGKDEEWKNSIRIDDVKIKDIKLVPYWEVTTEKITERYEDAGGNTTGYRHAINKVSTVRLYPDNPDSVKELEDKKPKKVK
jgi:hypothetical protein